MLTHLELPVYVIRHHRSDLDILDHILLTIAGMLATLFPLWEQIPPGQLLPFNVLPWIALGVLALSAIYGMMIARLLPGLADRVGAYVADQADR